MASLVITTAIPPRAVAGADPGVIVKDGVWTGLDWTAFPHAPCDVLAKGSN